MARAIARVTGYYGQYPILLEKNSAKTAVSCPKLKVKEIEEWKLKNE